MTTKHTYILTNVCKSVRTSGQKIIMNQIWFEALRRNMSPEAKLEIPKGENPQRLGNENEKKPLTFYIGWEFLQLLQ